MSKKNSLIKVVSIWDNSYLSWLDKSKFKSVISLREADIALFTGGPDVDPVTYGEKKGAYTVSSKDRERKDKTAFDQLAEDGNKFFVGICRGAQFLTIKAGGTLFQDVTGHDIIDTHNLDVRYDFLEYINKDITKAAMISLPVTSTHHQMMNPYILPVDDYRIVAYCQGNLSAWYLNGENDRHQTYVDHPTLQEPEIVMYDNINALCIQGHPERLKPNNITIKFLNNLLLAEYNKFKRKKRKTIKYD